MTTRRLLLQALLPLLALNALLGFGNLWPGVWPKPEARLSVELFAGLLALLVWTRWRGPPSPRALGAIAALTSLFVLLHYIDVTVPALLGRPVNAYWDGRHLWQLARMAGEHGAWWQWAALTCGVGVALALLYGGVRGCLAALAQGLASRALQRPLMALCVGVPIAAGVPTDTGHGLDRAFAPPVSAMLAEQAGLLGRALSPSHGTERFAGGPTFDGNVGALRGADVMIVFAEAYGTVTFDRPELAQALAPRRRSLRDALAASGRQVVSARVRSPTFGGASWLAHAALLSGIDTHDPDDYSLLLTTQRPTLVSHFARNGYRTVAWMPGLQRPWPEGAFYGFDRRADADGTGYTGLPFGYWRIPDQASIALLQHQELGDADPLQAGVRPVAPAATAPTRAPRFIVFPTLTTHAPFRPVPPYLADPQRLLAADAYSADEVATAMAAPVSWTDPTPAYIDAMRYQFDWLARWLRGDAPPGLLLIVIGDHQPVGGVTGPDASWDVPVHVISRDPALIARFEAAGFRRGLEPAAASLGAMNGLTQTLIDAFADELSAPRVRMP